MDVEHRPQPSSTAPSRPVIADQLSAITAASAALAGHFGATGPDTPVPTCPGWSIRDLVAHLGTVHRWATYVIENGVPLGVDVPPAAVPGDDALAGWLSEGAELLTAAIAAAPEDLQAMVFLKDAPAPREFWARRQAHESTVHAVDGLGARLGRLPTTKEAGVPAALAADGLDELLTGFVPRRSSRLRSETPLTCVIAPTDVERAWTLRLSPEPPVTTRGAVTEDEAGGPVTIMTGSAASLYLGLHNRGDEIAVTGEPELLGVWRDTVRISWA